MSIIVACVPKFLQNNETFYVTTNLTKLHKKGVQNKCTKNEEKRTRVFRGHPVQVNNKKKTERAKYQEFTSINIDSRTLVCASLLNEIDVSFSVTYNNH